MKSNNTTDARQIEFDAALRLLGTKLSQKWEANDSKNTADYRAMRQHVKDIGSRNQVDSWRYAEFQQGGSYEFKVILGDLTIEYDNYKNMPMTFNEALLWIRQFGYVRQTDDRAKSPIGKFFGKYVPGHRLEYSPNDNSGINYGMTVECTGATCDISYDQAD